MVYICGIGEENNWRKELDRRITSKDLWFSFLYYIRLAIAEDFTPYHSLYISSKINFQLRAYTLIYIPLWYAKKA